MKHEAWMLLHSVRSHWRAHQHGMVLNEERGWQAVREWVGVAIIQYAWDRWETDRPYRWVQRIANWVLP